ncbi:MAG: tetratricopeptide repeat protein [Gemmatimonadetes bacterium]|nr:tetratricopeptide repeat protein [Gemmatimonadota bacterium]
MSPELVEVASGRAPSTKWQEPFDAALTNVFQVQADIAERVAGALDVALGTEQRQALAARPTANLAAYDAYLKGQEVWNSGSSVPAERRRAIEFFERAVALDSTFAPAWAQLARVHAAIYASLTPTSAGAEKAREASQRALALAPTAAESQLAFGAYLDEVRDDPSAALVVYDAGLRVAPENVELLAATALAEQAVGDWEAAQAHFARALALDPRSVTTARRRARALLYLRRYPEAEAAYQRALALAPSNLDLLQGRAMVPLALGDLEGARKVLRSAPSEVEPAALVAFMATYLDLVWVLDSQQRRLLLGLGPDSFADDDRAPWALALTQAYALDGDSIQARAFADSARLALDEQLRDTPDDAQLHVLLGLALAYLGRDADAVREGEHGAALTPIARNTYRGSYFQHQLARIYMLVGSAREGARQARAAARDPVLPLAGVVAHRSELRSDSNASPLPKFDGGIVARRGASAPRVERHANRPRPADERHGNRVNWVGR